MEMRLRVNISLGQYTVVFGLFFFFFSFVQRGFEIKVSHVDAALSSTCLNTKRLLDTSEKLPL